MSQESVMDGFMEAKTRLKAYTDKNGYEKPVYETVSKRIDDVRKVYKVRVTIEGLVEITGEGYSRRLAEYRAAINAWNEIIEVREEQKKSKAEEQSAKDLKNGVTDISSEEVPNDSNGVKPVSNDDSVPQLNGHHNGEDNSSDNDVKSIKISADINTIVGEPDENKYIQVNRKKSDDKSEGTSNGSPDIQTNGIKEDNSLETGENSNEIKMNGNSLRSEFISGASLPTFKPIQKSPVQQLHDFCVAKQSPYPFYDTTYKDRTFLIKCRIEFTEEEEKREFFGTGTGNTSKEAKLMAAEDIVQQLDVLGFM